MKMVQLIMKLIENPWSYSKLDWSNRRDHKNDWGNQIENGRRNNDIDWINQWKFVNVIMKIIQVIGKMVVAVITKVIGVITKVIDVIMKIWIKPQIQNENN